MSAFAGWNTQDRYGRHVRQALLRVDAHAPVTRLAFTIEEALRLASLPGENEGRAYYFRRLRVDGLPADGDRAVWLARFQSALERQAAQALYGGDARAQSAEAVYFHAEQEALELLLHRTLARQANPEWFWPMVMGAGESGESAGRVSIPEVIAKLRARPASWVAVAAALFAVGGFDAARLLQSIPPGLVENWLREMGSSPVFAAGNAPRDFSPIFTCGAAGDSYAGSHGRPGGMAGGDGRAGRFARRSLAAATAVARARLALARLADEAACESAVSPQRRSCKRVGPRAAVEKAPARAGAGAAAAREASGANPPELSQSERASSAVATEHSCDRAALESLHRDARRPDSTASPAEVPPQTRTPLERQTPVTEDRSHTARLDPSIWYCAGLPTNAAGFFFLLNALESLGIAEALALGPSQARSDFVPRLLLHLAKHAEVPPDDPIALWLRSLAATLPREPDGAGEYVVRIWSLAVRRWCWHVAKIRVRDMVTRPGVFSVNRTDLDVSLPLDVADVRIRRAGLDLDPGWLPWFGRVVRFHYLFRGEFRG